MMSLLLLPVLLLIQKNLLMTQIVGDAVQVEVGEESLESPPLSSLSMMVRLFVSLSFHI